MARPYAWALVLVIMYLAPTWAAWAVGDSCSTAEDHCGAPKSGLSCCYSYTKCYEQSDCAAYLSACPFTDETKKGKSLVECLPDKTDFAPAKCPAGVKTAEGIPLKSTVKCFESGKLLCNVYKNDTHKFITAKCKPANATTTSAAATRAAGSVPLMVAAIAAVLLAALML